MPSSVLQMKQIPEQVHCVAGKDVPHPAPVGPLQSCLMCTALAGGRTPRAVGSRAGGKRTWEGRSLK